MDSADPTPSASDIAPEVESLVDDSLTEKREIIRNLIAEKPQIGDSLILVSADYIERFLMMPVHSWLEIVESLGPLDFGLITDENGLLSASSNTCSISPKAFDLLSEWLGVEGSPIERCLIHNPQTSSAEIEEFPPTFFVHIVGTPRKQQPTNSYTRYGSNNRNNATNSRELPPSISISGTKTFADLLLEVSKLPHVKKGKISRFRAWLINSANINDFQSTISPLQFTFDIAEKQVVLPSIMHTTLLSQGLGGLAQKYHLLIDTQDSNNEFAINSYVAGLNMDAYKPTQDLAQSGHLGLSNLGNTCYMNSALQCLLHVPELNDYFFYNVYQKELNLDNPLGCHGNIASSFGNLLKLAFEPNATTSFVTPREFKSMIGRYSSMFSGYMQQDSQEFLSWLLDSIHEDLNRIHVKPYCEKPELLDDDDPSDPIVLAHLAAKCWDQHKLRNDSVIVDLFTGMYQSTLVCPTCNKTSVTFDPFSDMTLLLPIEKKWYHTFTIVDCSSERKVIRLEVELNKTCNFDDLVTYLARFLNVNAGDLFLYEWYNSSFIRDYQCGRDNSRHMPIGDLIRNSDTVIVYHVPHDPQLDVIVPVYNLLDATVAQCVGLPVFVVLPKEHQYSTAFIGQKVEEVTRIHPNARPIASNDCNPIDDDSTAEDTASETPHNTDACVDDPEALDEPQLPFTLKYCLLQSPPKYRSFSARDADTSQAITIPLRPINFQDFELLVKGVGDESSAADKPESEDSDDDIAESSSQASAPDHPPYSLPLLGTLDEELVSDGEPFQSDLLSDVNCPEPVMPPRESHNSQSDLANSSASPLSSGPPVASSASSLLSSPQAMKNPKGYIELTATSIFLCLWKKEKYVQAFGTCDNSAWLNAPLASNPELERNKARFERQRGRKISLYDCLKSFNTPEVLGEHDLWYCPRCKDHKQATKTIQVQTVGDILTIHLKRFHSARAFSDKIDVVVDFPITGLDMSPYLSSASVSHLENIYDLIAVDNHYGGLGGGHYTASVKNFRDGKWYYFDDSRASPIKDPAECITGAAYLLFYRKRVQSDNSTSGTSLGGPQLTEMLAAGRAEYFESLQVKEKQVAAVMERIAAYDQDSLATSEPSTDETLCEDQDASQQSAEDLVKRQFKSIDDSDDPSKPVSFNFDDDDDIDYDSDNTRKQRLLSKQSDFNKLLHIRSNGKLDLSSSPLGDIVYDSDIDQTTK